MASVPVVISAAIADVSRAESRMAVASRRSSEIIPRTASERRPTSPPLCTAGTSAERSPPATASATAASEAAGRLTRAAIDIPT